MLIQPCKYVVLLLLVCTAALRAAEDDRSAYILGPEDEITINVVDLDEAGEAPLRVDLDGNINVPLIGRVHAGGLTIEQLETQLVERFRKYLTEPHVTVGIKEFGSQPVSVLGAVNKPGIHQLHGRRTLFEVLSMAEGLRNDAGNTIKITRKMKWGKLPLPNASTDATQEFSVGEVAVSSVMQAKNPQENIVIMPYDVISVARAAVVYVVGDVKKSGGFVLGEKNGISALQAVALADGLERGAAPSRARIFRSVDNASGKRIEIPVNLSNVLSGKGPDVPLYADDILFVPTNGPKKAGYRALETALQITTGVIIWRR